MHKVLLFLGVIMSFFTSNSQAAATHEALTLEDVWLNVERPLHAKDLENRIILVDFWTYCCINCIHIVPELAKLEKEFGNDLTVIGVHSAKFNNEKDTENIRQAIVRYDIHHAVVNDANFRIWRTFGVRAWPTLVLINPKGEIERVYSGEGHTDEIRQDVERLRKEYKGEFVNTALPYAWEEDKQAPSVLAYPGKIEYAEDIDLFFVSDSNNNRIVAFDEDGDIQLEIGSGEIGKQDGSFEEASFNQPQGIAYKNGAVYVADTKNHMIRRVDLASKTVTTVAGTGVQGYDRRVFGEDALTTKLASPWDVAFYPNDHTLAIAMAGTHQLWTLDLKESEVSILAGNGRESIDDGPYPRNSLSQPSGLSVYEDKLYFVDSETSSLRVLENGVVTTLIGEGLFDFGLKDGTKRNARMQHTIGVFADETGVYMADTYNHAIRKYNPKTGQLTTLSGYGKRGFENIDYRTSTFSEPNDVLRLKDGRILVVDTNNHAIRVLQNNIVKTFALMPKEEEFEITYTDVLPNVELQDDVKVKAKSSIESPLKKGWKINKDAPTYLGLFDKDQNLVAGYKKDDIVKGDISLPKLDNGEYTAQGIFYICEDTKESFCYIKSIEQNVNVSDDGDIFKLNLYIPQMDE